MPIQISSTQRVGLVAALLLAVAVLFLHNPTGGYVWERTQTGFRYLEKPPSKPNPACNAQRLNELLPSEPRNLSAAETRERAKLLEVCFPGEVTERVVTLQLSEWTSRNAVIPWFANVANTLWSLFAVLVGAGVWFAMFRAPVVQTKE